MNKLAQVKGCEAGCSVFSCGSIGHIKDCQHYPDSMQQMIDDKNKDIERLRELNKPVMLQFIDNGSGQLFTAKTPFVDYEIFEGRGGWCAEYKFGVACIPLIRQKGVGKEMAIKICQDDFESRIRECMQ